MQSIEIVIIMVSVVMLSVITLDVVWVSAIKLNVVAPCFKHVHFQLAVCSKIFQNKRFLDQFHFSRLSFGAMFFYRTTLH
jgi:hypothetical protein